MRKESIFNPVVGVICGILLYEVSDTVLYLIQPLLFPTLLRVLGVILILISIKKTTTYKIKGIIGGLYKLLIIWSFFILLRGSLVGNYLPGAEPSLMLSVRTSFLDSYGGMVYLIPLVAIMNFRLNGLFPLRRVALFLCVASLVFMFIARDELVRGMINGGKTSFIDVAGNNVTVRNLIHAAFPGFGLLIFYLFNSNYLKTKLSVFLPISIFVFFIGYAIGGGRGMTFFSLMYLIMFFYLSTRYSVSVTTTKKLRGNLLLSKNFVFLILGISFVSLLVYLYNSTEIFDYVLERAFGGKTLGTSVDDDSRDILVHDMLNDFNASPFDWIWGRGVNGSYTTNNLSIGGKRAWMELSYYYLILKGGVVFLLLFVSCFLHAAYMGCFKSRNLFSKAMGFVCISMLINLASASAIPQFSTFYLISWLSFGLIERKEIREMSDVDIYGYFNIKNYKRKI